MEDMEVEEVDHFGPELVLPGSELEEGTGTEGAMSPLSPLPPVGDDDAAGAAPSSAMTAGKGVGGKVPLTAEALAMMEEEEEAKDGLGAIST